MENLEIRTKIQYLKGTKIEFDGYTYIVQSSIEVSMLDNKRKKGYYTILTKIGGKLQ